MRNQVFKKNVKGNMGSMAGQLGVRREVKENSKIQEHRSREKHRRMLSSLV